MIQFWDIGAEKTEYKEEVIDLYENAFPDVEKKSFDWMMKLAQEGKMEIKAITEDNEDMAAKRSEPLHSITERKSLFWK